MAHTSPTRPRMEAPLRALLQRHVADRLNLGGVDLRSATKHSITGGA